MILSSLLSVCAFVRWYGRKVGDRLSGHTACEVDTTETLVCLIAFRIRRVFVIVRKFFAGLHGVTKCQYVAEAGIIASVVLNVTILTSGCK